MNHYPSFELMIEAYEPFTCHHCDSESPRHDINIAGLDAAVCTYCLITYYPGLVELQLPQPPEFYEVA